MPLTHASTTPRALSAQGGPLDGAVTFVEGELAAQQRRRLGRSVGRDHSCVGHAGLSGISRVSR